MWVPHNQLQWWACTSWQEQQQRLWCLHRRAVYQSHRRWIQPKHWMWTLSLHPINTMDQLSRQWGPTLLIMQRYCCIRELESCQGKTNKSHEEGSEEARAHHERNQKKALQRKSANVVEGVASANLRQCHQGGIEVVRAHHERHSKKAIQRNSEYGFKGEAKLKLWGHVLNCTWTPTWLLWRLYANGMLKPVNFFSPHAPAGALYVLWGSSHPGCQTTLDFNWCLQVSASNKMCQFAWPVLVGSFGKIKLLSAWTMTSEMSSQAHYSSGSSKIGLIMRGIERKPCKETVHRD